MSDSTYLPNFQIILFEMDETIMFGRCVKVIFDLPHSCLQQLFWRQQTSAELIASIFSRLMVRAEKKEKKYVYTIYCRSRQELSNDTLL